MLLLFTNTLRRMNLKFGSNGDAIFLRLLIDKMVKLESVYISHPKQS